MLIKVAIKPYFTLVKSSQYMKRNVNLTVLGNTKIKVICNSSPKIQVNSILKCKTSKRLTKKMRRLEVR